MGEDNKLSWREIDKLKETSGFSKVRRKLEKEKRATLGLKEDKRAKERYLKELEKLFSSKNDLEKEDFLKKLHQSVGKREFKKLLKEFYNKFGLPDKARDLLLFLEMEEREVFLKTLEKIKEKYSEFNQQDRQGIISKLRSLVISIRDDFLSYRIEKLIKEISS